MPSAPPQPISTGLQSQPVVNNQNQNLLGDFGSTTSQAPLIPNKPVPDLISGVKQQSQIDQLMNQPLIPINQTQISQPVGLSQSRPSITSPPGWNQTLVNTTSNLTGANTTPMGSQPVVQNLIGNVQSPPKPVIPAQPILGTTQPLIGLTQTSQPLGGIATQSIQPLGGIANKPVQPLGGITSQPGQPLGGMATQPVQPLGGIANQLVQPLGGIGTQPVQPLGGVTTQPSAPILGATQPLSGSQTLIGWNTPIVGSNQDPLVSGLTSPPLIPTSMVQSQIPSGVTVASLISSPPKPLNTVAGSITGQPVTSTPITAVKSDLSSKPGMCFKIF